MGTQGDLRSGLEILFLWDFRHVEGALKEGLDLDRRLKRDLKWGSDASCVAVVGKIKELLKLS